jgi:hypothetical protein
LSATMNEVLPKNLNRAIAKKAKYYLHRPPTASIARAAPIFVENYL